MTLWTKKPQNVKKDIMQQACYKIYTQHNSFIHHYTYIFFLLYTWNNVNTTYQLNKRQSLWGLWQSPIYTKQTKYTHSPR